MYSITGISGKFAITNLSNDFHIVIHNPLDVPPHIMLFYNTKYYSLSYNKCVVSHDAFKLLTIFESKKTPLLIIKLAIPYLLDNEKIIKAIFNKYHVAGKNNVTCLTPIKEVLTAITKASTNNVNYIYELIPLLQTSGFISKIEQLNLDPKIENATFKLLTYSKDDIFAKIKQLQITHYRAGTYTNKF